MSRRIITEADLPPDPTSAPTQVMAPPPPAPPLSAGVVLPPPPAIPVVPAAPPPTPSRGSAGPLLVALAVFAIIGTGIGMFFVGQSTRASEAEVEQRLTEQATTLGTEHEQELTNLRRDLNRDFQRRVETRTLRAERRGEARGRSEGRAEGQSQGRQEGYQQGRDAGERSGFERGTCYTPGTYTYVC